MMEHSDCLVSTAGKILLSMVGQERIDAALCGDNLGNGFASVPRVTQEHDGALRLLGFDSREKPSRAELSRRYRQLAKSWHPDKLPGARSMHEDTRTTLGADVGDRFREIKAAA